MILIETRYEHIVLDKAGTPRIVDTRMKVIELVESQRASGWSPEELQMQHPPLTLGQIHSALAYYWDHQAELDTEIARRLAWADQMWETTPSIPLVQRLRVQGLLPHQPKDSQPVAE